MIIKQLRKINFKIYGDSGLSFIFDADDGYAINMKFEFFFIYVYAVMLQCQSEIKSIRNFYFPVFFSSRSLSRWGEKMGHNLKNMYSNLCIDLEGSCGSVQAKFRPIPMTITILISHECKNSRWLLLLRDSIPISIKPNVHAFIIWLKRKWILNFDLTYILFLGHLRIKPIKRNFFSQKLVSAF